ncbi:MAG: antibiotic biosynthesis monooxygenase [Ignavibacteria bacterium]|nr:antibiotic biosynthesis monooxygenase [Ignavibacteria bacterium]
MHLTCVHVQVKKENLEEFIEATMENHRNSVMEPGNLRFDFLQSKNDPCRFMLYEVYRTESDAKAHKETMHYIEWKDRAANWMEKPREGAGYTVLAPKDDLLWK